MGDRYILITPVKNEESNLPGLIDSIINQSLRPILWVIVDDYSNDRTPDIIESYSRNNSFIKMITLINESNYDVNEHYAEVCSKGFKYAVDYCEKEFKRYDYIALSDADMIYPKEYFFKLIEFLNDNPEYGIISGKIQIKEGEEIYEEKATNINSLPWGTGRVWRKEAFEETEGYLLTKSPDTVSNILAQRKGWMLDQIDVLCYQTRPTGAGNNLWEGFLKRGESVYYLGGSPLIILNSVLDLVIISRQRNSLIKSWGLICGYFSSFFLRKKQIDIEEVKEFYNYRQTLKHYMLFIKSIFNSLQERLCKIKNH